LPYIVAAGEQAGRTSSTSEAIDWFRRAIPILAEANDPALGRRTYEGLGKALELANRGAEAAATYAEMRDQADYWGDIPMRVSALNKLAFVRALRLGEFEAAQQTLAEAEELARSAADGRGLVELATIKCGMCLPMANFPAAINTLGDSVEVARAKDMREELATALAHLALTQTYATRFEDAWRAAQEGRRLAEELGNLSHVAELLAIPIPLYLLRNGDPPAALAAVQEGVGIAARIGDGVHLVQGSVTMAMLQLDLGDYQAAAASAGIVVGAAEQLGPYAPFALPMALAELLAAAYAMGGRAAYEEAAQRNAGMLAAMEPYMDALACRLLGQCALAMGDLDAAEARFKRGLEQPSGSWLLERPQLLANLASVKIARGELDAARQLLQEAREYAAERGMRHVEPLLEQVQTRLSASVPG
jgi:tetratricopeptide (TPR) repeat protein